MKALKRLLWLPIITLMIISCMISALPLIIILGGESYDKKIMLPLINFCYNKFK